MAHGRYRFKGIKDSVEVFEVGLEGLAPLTQPPDSDTAKRVHGYFWLSAVRALCLALVAFAMLYIGYTFPYYILLKTRSASVAVMGFENQTGNPSAEWYSTGISEILTADLAIGNQIRAIDGRKVAGVRRDLSLATMEVLPPEELDRLRMNLTIDFIVLGSFSFEGGDDAVHLRYRVLNARNGKIRREAAVDGSRQSLVELAHDAADEIRKDLGAPVLSSEQKQLIQATFPVDPDAAADYFKGLDSVQRFDVVAARNFFQESLEKEDENPLPLLALAYIWSYLGNVGEAEKAAQRANDLAGKLPSEKRRFIEAHFHETIGQWSEAASIYKALFQEYEDIEYGLWLAEAQINAGGAEEALRTIETLRKRRVSVAEAGQIDLLAAEAYYSLEDYEKSVTFSGEAVWKGENAGTTYLQARALLREGDALECRGDYPAAMEALDRARELFGSARDSSGVFAAFAQMAIIFSRKGELDKARKIFETHREKYRRDGATLNEIEASIGLAYILIDLGEFENARAVLEEPLVALDELARPRVAEADVALGVAFQMAGKLEKAQERYEKALATFQELGDRLGAAAALTNLGKLLFIAGDLEGSERMHADSLAINREIDYPSGMAYDIFRLGEVFAAQGRLNDARARFEEALATQEELEEVTAAAETELSLVRLNIEQENYGEAKERTERVSETFWRANMADLATLAEIVRARALLEQSAPDVSEAQGICDEVQLHAFLSEDPRVGFETAILSARVKARNRSTGGAEGPAVAALRKLEEVEERATELGYLGYVYEARLAMGEVEMMAGRSQDATSRLAALIEEAEGKGFGLIAERARKLLLRYGTARLDDVSRPGESRSNWRPLLVTALPAPIWCQASFKHLGLLRGPAGGRQRSSGTAR